MIFDDEKLAGFAMVNPYSYLGKKPDYVMAEFTIFPMYRKKQIGARAAECIFESLKGKWELKYNEKNEAAKAFWNKIAAPYKPVKHLYSDTETVLEFSTIQ